MRVSGLKATQSNQKWLTANNGFSDFPFDDPLIACPRISHILPMLSSLNRLSPCAEMVNFLASRKEMPAQ